MEQADTREQFYDHLNCNIEVQGGVLNIEL